MKIKRLMRNAVRRVVDHFTGSGLMQAENEVPMSERYITPGMPELIRECGAEGIVLLKNENNTLPLKAGEQVAVFGRCQLDWFYVGYGSGGDVHPPYKVNLMDGLRNAGVKLDKELAGAYADWTSHPDNQADHGWWGHWPYFHPEMPLTSAQVNAAAENADTAIVVIGRAAGEDRENGLFEGSYYLTAVERDMLRKVCAVFKKVVLVMNCGSIIDMGFAAEYPVSAILYAWQLGQESGNAVADVLTGRVNPSGRLTDTIAERYEDYPSAPCFGNREFNNYTEDVFVGYRYFDIFGKKVLWPFGFGLSYTDFEMECILAERTDSATRIAVKVTNTGRVPGKQVVQAYCRLPLGRLAKPAKVLVGFAKTGVIAPGEAETVELVVRDMDCASYDDALNAFVLEPGTYAVAVGANSAEVRDVFAFEMEEELLLEMCSEVCPPVTDIPIMTRDGMANARRGSRDLKQRILDNMPDEIAYTGDRGIMLSDVKSGGHTLEEFVAQLSEAELSDLTRGEGGMGSKLGIVGNAGAFGGITEKLRSRGIPALITADGPSGLRVKKHTALMPCGTAIACTWNTALIERMFEKEGEEARHFGVDVVLSPGMNIHRNPLCGRNFEYYSEDPLLTGKVAAAAVRGIQKGGTSACPKHFACNNQEVNRNYNDSRLSQRALREVYLKGFEICVKEGKPQHIMTSYNKINGMWSHYNYDLATTVLRNEWDYEGNILTDWWMRMAESPEFPGVKNNAYRVRAQVDVLMPGGLTPVKQKYVFDKTMLETVGRPEGLTRGELQRTAMNVLRFALMRM